MKFMSKKEREGGGGGRVGGNQVASNLIAIALA